MSALGMFLVFVGLAVAITRAPLIFAPETTRGYFFTLFQTPRNMRLVGVFMLIVGFVATWVGATTPGTLAAVIQGFGLAFCAISALAILPFPGSMGALATKVMAAFSAPVLRVLGVIAVVFGVWLAWFGTTL